ncbi:hypothetical protein KKE78_00830 [Patescibacteria group bacterium]|nr:hypothetical protein [Patescibacteria group bacterium]
MTVILSLKVFYFYDLIELMNKYGFSSIVVLIVTISVIGLGIIGAIFSPQLIKKITQHSISTSETQYRNNSEHFIDDQKLISFDYPKGATSVKGVSPSPIGGVSFQAYFREWLTDPNSWSITIVGVPIVDNVEKTKHDIFDTLDFRESKISNYTEIMETSISGEKAMSYKTESELPSDTKIISMLIETVHGSMLYSIGITISDKTNQEAVKEATEAYNLIRNSFKFLK